MQLVIDVARNRLVIDGHEVEGRRRWEAATLGVLVRGGHVSATSGCGATELQSALQAFGQVRPLNRKQISRLWEGITQMFGAAGQRQALAVRMGHPARGLTVGPWWWAAQPQDKVRVLGSTASAAVRLQLPSLTRRAGQEQVAALCRHVAVCEALIVEGRYAEAVVTLEDTDAWHHASPEFDAFRLLRLADVQTNCGAFDAADAALNAGEDRLAQCDVAELHLAGAAKLARCRLHYRTAPVRGHGRILGEIVPLIHQAPSTRSPEVDRYTRGLTLNLAALCERRWLEGNARRCSSATASAHLATALRYWSAALFSFITSNQYEFTQNMCSNIGHLLQSAFQLGLDVSPRAALEWYAAAQIWQNRFDLADNNVWEYIFIGEFWLHGPQARDAFAAMTPRIGWMGHAPDELAFYQCAMKRAQQIGEPRQIAHAALNLWRFAQLRRLRSAAEDGKATLAQQLKEYPSVEVILRSEGYQLP